MKESGDNSSGELLSQLSIVIVNCHNSSGELLSLDQTLLGLSLDTIRFVSLAMLYWPYIIISQSLY